jgi:hypothetical protein
MPDQISNYRQVRLILNPHNGDWTKAYWSVHFVSVRQGVPRTEVADHGLIEIPSKTPTQAQFWHALAVLCMDRGE